jgi:Fe-S-cluster containining protein
MAQRDTLDKIVESYFAAITTHPFIYKGKTYEPAPLRVSKGLLRGFTCPAGCGGCCPTFSLDYLPSENAPYELIERTVDFNGKKINLYSDMQKENKHFKCKNLNLENGRCGIHGRQPFSCDFELIRFINRQGVWHVNEQLFSRGWAMRITDGGTGAKCTITEATQETAEDVARRIRRLCEWADHFGLQNHKGTAILEWINKYLKNPSEATTIIL